MYDMPNQTFVKRFAAAPYSAGAAGESERGALELLKSTHLAEVDYLLGSTLLARVVNCSMWPRAPRQARAEEEAGTSSAAEEEEQEEEEEAAPEAVGLAALYGKGLRRAVEAVLEQHCNAAVDHLVHVDLRSALKRAAAAAAAANADEEQAALEECRESVVTHAVQLFTQLVRGPGFSGRKLDADLKLLAKQFRDCVKADIAAAKAEILSSWQASLSAFGNASAPVQEAAPEPKDAGLSARLEAQLQQVRGPCPALTCLHTRALTPARPSCRAAEQAARCGRQQHARGCAGGAARVWTEVYHRPGDAQPLPAAGAGCARSRAAAAAAAAATAAGGGGDAAASALPRAASSCGWRRCAHV